MKLIVGLGNPGAEYEQTRHNIGFGVLDFFGSGVSAVFRKGRCSALEAKLEWEGIRVVLIKPQTFMNLSGEAVVGALRFYKLHPDSLLVIHDDLDLPLGRMKFASGGSSGGHHGVESIINILNTPQFARLRVGIGRPAETREGADYVLSPFSEGERAMVKEVCEKGGEAVALFLKNGLQTAMNHFNVKEKK